MENAKEILQEGLKFYHHTEKEQLYQITYLLSGYVFVSWVDDDGINTVRYHQDRVISFIDNKQWILLNT